MNNSIAYDFHHNRMEIGIGEQVDNEDMTWLVDVALENGCNSIVQWVDVGKCNVIWSADNGNK